jgi:hypothetical protein
MNNFKLDGRTIAIGLLLLVAAVIFLPRLFNTDATNVQEPVNQPLDEANEGDILLGNPVSASAIDRDGCPVETTNVFSPSEDVFVVAPSSDIPAGTAVFVRLYHEDTPIEDAPEIQADQDYQNTCINFVFEPNDGSFDPGSYEAEFFINGNSADSVQFEIQ